MRRLLFVSLAALLLAGCGEKAEGGGANARPDKFRLILDYFPNADHAGIYAAQASGEFAKAGLDVEIVTPPDPSAPLKLLQAGKADLAVSYEPELLLARDKGAALVAVGAIVQKPLTTLMALPSGKVNSAKDLEGKRVGTAGIPYQDAYLKTIAAKAGVEDVKSTNVGFNLVPAMISKRVDATLGAFWNYEGVDLERRGKHPVILRMEELGVPTYAELILVARTKDLDATGAAKLRRFLQALARGHAQLKTDPEKAVGALLAANKDLEKGLQTDSVRATLPVFFPEDPEQPWGVQDPEDWIAYGEWMYENKLLTKDPHAERAVTNEFLPGKGLRE